MTMLRSLRAVLLGLILAVPFVAEAQTVRYRDAFFSATDSKPDVVYSGIKDSVGQPLAMDFFSPKGDTQTKRPFIAVIHGGSCDQGSRKDSDMQAWAKDYALRGYVTASVEYRLDPQEVGTCDNGQSDVHSAIRYVRAHADEFGVDPKLIFAAGFSTGARLAWGVAANYEAAPGSNSGNPGYDSRAYASVLVGIGTGQAKNWPKTGDPVTYITVGGLDPSLHYSEDVKAKADALGIVNVFKVYPGQPHNLFTSGFRADIVKQSALFLYANALPATTPVPTPPAPTSTRPPDVTKTRTPPPTATAPPSLPTCVPPVPCPTCRPERTVAWTPHRTRTATPDQGRFTATPTLPPEKFTPTPTLPPPPPGAILKVGYGAVTNGGATTDPRMAAPDTCVVTKLADDGSAGTFRHCILTKLRVGPRTVAFAVGGTIKISKTLGTIKINTPYLTIDGSTAPVPGITFENPDPLTPNDFLPGIKIGATHDVIVHNIRATGLFIPNDPTTYEKNESGPLSIDGDAGASTIAWDPDKTICQAPTDKISPVRSVCRLIFDKVTIAGSADEGPDFWCGVRDITISRSLMYGSYHPRGTGCDGVKAKGSHDARERITDYANVMAYGGERQPKLNEGVYDYDHVNNIVAFWQDYGTEMGNGPSGYGMLVEDNGDVDLLNVIGNVWLPDTKGEQGQICAADSTDARCRRSWDCVWGGLPKCDGTGGQNCEAALRANRVHYSGNLFGPWHNANECISTASGQQPIPRPYALTVYQPGDLEAKVLDVAGSSPRTVAEQKIIDEVRVDLRAAVQPGKPTKTPVPPGTQTPTPAVTSKPTEKPTVKPTTNPTPPQTPLPTVPPPPSPTPGGPVIISDIVVARVDATLATIRWATKGVKATSQIEYGEAPNPNRKTREWKARLVTLHEQMLFGLKPGTLHYYRVISKDAKGGTAVSPTASFTTLAVAKPWPSGIPKPPFGVGVQHGPATHLVDNRVACVSTGTGLPPAKPLCTIPLSPPGGSVIEVKPGTYKYNSAGVVFFSDATAANPTFLYGVDEGEGFPILDMPDPWLIQGKYVVMERFYVQAGTLRTAYDSMNKTTKGQFIVIREVEATNHPVFNGLDIFGLDNVAYDNFMHHNQKAAMGGDGDAMGIFVGSGAQRSWIVNNLLAYNAADGVHVNGGFGVRPRWVYIAGNTSHGNRENGSDNKHGDDVHIIGNELFAHKGHYGTNQFCYSDDSLCFITNPNNISDGSAIVIGSDGATGNAVIAFNNVHDNDRGMRIEENVGDTMMIGNLFVNNKWECIVTQNPVKPMIAVGNTCVGSNDGIYSGAVTAAWTIENNVLCGITRYGIHLGPEASKGSAYNNLLCKGHVKWNLEYTFATTADMTQKFPGGTKNVIGSPSFVNEAAGDYHLKAGSPAIDAGKLAQAYATFQSRYGYSLQQDYDGKVIPVGAGIDMGAFESP